MTIAVKKIDPHLKWILMGVNILHFYCQRPPSCISGVRGWSEWHTLHNLAFGWFPPPVEQFEGFSDCCIVFPILLEGFPLLLEWFHVVEGGFPYHPVVFSNWQSTVSLWVSQYQGQFNGSDRRFDQPKKRNFILIIWTLITIWVWIFFLAWTLGYIHILEHLRPKIIPRNGPKGP